MIRHLGVEISVNRRPAGHGLNRRRTSWSRMVIIVTSIYRVELKVSIFILYIHFTWTYYLCFSFIFLISYLRDYDRDLLLNYIEISFINLTIYFFSLRLSRFTPIPYAPQALAADCGDSRIFVHPLRSSQHVYTEANHAVHAMWVYKYSQSHISHPRSDATNRLIGSSS